MKLFNKTIDRQLFKQYALGSDLSKQEVVVKIFNPVANGTWFILNSDPQDPDYLWAIVDLGYGAEVGSVSRSELETYRGRFGMGFERDLSFDPVNALELYNGLHQGKYYANGGLITEDNLKEEEWFSPDMKVMYQYRNGRLGITLFYGKDRRYSKKTVINNASELSIKELNSRAKEEITELKQFAKEILENNFADGGNLSRDRKFLNHNEQYEVDYSKGKNRKGYGYADGGEVSFVNYKDCEIMYEPNYKKYYANDVEFDTLQEAKDFIDSEEVSADIRNAYSRGLFADGGEIEVVYERRADFKKKPIKLLLLNKGKEQKGFTFSGKDQVAVLDNYNRNKQEDLEKLWNLKGYESKYADGGDIESFSDNQRMIMNQNVEVEHHHEELEDILEDEVQVPAWVVAKMETSTQNLSDITHYLDGQKELMEDENEEEEEDQDEIENKEVVEPINVSAGTKAELTKKFTNDAWGNLRGFLKGMEGIDLRDDYTFDYKNEQFEVEPIINSDENGVSNAVFTIFDGDGEEVGEVAYSRDGGKQKFTANSDYFQWNNAKFEDGGYFDGAIPNTSAYMSTYAKGGEIAKAEILGFSRNVMGTTDIEMKITGMRKPQDFIVYPIGKDDAGSVITIQSDTRIGQINLVKGVGVMSQSHSNGAYFVHLQIDKLTSFTVSESDLDDIKSHIFRTAGSNVGTRGIVSDNSGASRLFADGGNFANGGDIDVEHWLTINKEFGKPKWQSQESQDFNGVFNEVVDVYNRMLNSRYEPKITPQENKQIKELAQKFFKIKGFVTFNIVEGMANEIIKPRLKLVYYSNGGGVGFIPMALEQDLSYTAKWGGTDIKGVIGILNAMIDSGLTDEDLKPKPTKSGTAHQNAIEKKTNEIWSKIEPNYKGGLKGNMPYGIVRRLVDRANYPDDILKRFKPFRKNQKDSFADGGGVEKIRWQDVEKGDSARVKELNRMGLITHIYGRKFNLKFPNGTEKTFDASDLDFYKLEKDEYEIDNHNNYSKGGKISNFDKLSAKVAKEYEGKPVKSEYQDEYGKVYSKKEAKEIGNKVAGKVKAMQSDKKAFGGLFSGVKSKLARKTYADLDDKMVVTKDGRTLQVVDQSDDILLVIDANKLGSGVLPHKINISEIDPTSYKAEGKVAVKKANGGTETLKKANELAKKIRKDGESWLDARKRAFAQLKK